ncbi:hypothetical protein AN958_12139 [Leucoagaricus sp. SymC.cos]|nr:hypothetical protein AN958_12139 [Leucoagaricus sp. SymC.cos]
MKYVLILLEHPDFKRYKHIRTLSSEEFPIDDPHRRVIILGDIHGMEKPFRAMLNKLDYDGRNDVLVHTGDVLLRGRRRGSLAIIDFMTTHNITGVRGNHEQKIIEWKGWLVWFDTLPGASEWLAALDTRWRLDHQSGHKLKAWVKSQRQRSRGRDAVWWDHIPQGWVPFGVHYRIAEKLTGAQAAYLISLPLKLHIPSAHTFVVHAGLLPYDVRYDYENKRQPLARVPRLGLTSPSNSEEKTQVLRNLQELAILLRVPQNTSPWVNLNMRSVRKNNVISRAPSKGTPWMKFWNDQMDLCAGFRLGKALLEAHGQEVLLTPSEKSLPCYPSSVIYGHTASRGLDINQHSFGLDTGCVYGRELTAMILGPKPLVKEEEWEVVEDKFDEIHGVDEPEDWIDSDDELLEGDEQDNNDDDNFDRDHLEEGAFDINPRSLKQARTIKFGEHGEAKVVQVSCS